MSRVVIDLGILYEDGDRKVAIRVEEPPDLANHPWYTIDVQDLRIDEEQPECVLEAGEQIYNRIAAHQAIEEALRRVAEFAPGKEKLPVRLRMSPGNEADEVPWEALFLPAKNQFVALDRRWPIARIAGHGSGESHVEPFSGPLKLVAVLAALDRMALPEWEAIHDSVRALNKSIKVTVLCSEDDVFHAVEDAGHRAEYVPETAEGVIRCISVERPHLLHVFSHASSESGFLEIATRSAAELGDPDGLVYLDADQFTAAARNTWLTVLNACEGADPTSNGRSFAFAIVASGIPAAIGMRKEIRVNDAHSFARAFYREALRYIASEIKAGRPAEIDWSDVVRTTREELVPRGNATEKNKNETWTLPVLYVCPDGFLVWKVKAPPALLEDELREVIATLRLLENYQIPPDADDDFRNQIQARVAELRARLVS